MYELLKICLVTCPMLFLEGFVDSVIGGGGRISLPGYLFAGIPVHITAGTNKAVDGISTGVAQCKDQSLRRRLDRECGRECD